MGPFQRHRRYGCGLNDHPLTAPFENEASHLNENFFKAFLGHDISMASAKSGDFSNKYVAEIFPRGIRNALVMFVGPGSIWDSSREPESKQIIGIEKFFAPTRSFTPSHLEGRGCSRHCDQIVKQDFISGHLKQRRAYGFREADFLV